MLGGGYPVFTSVCTTISARLSSEIEELLCVLLSMLAGCRVIDGTAIALSLIPQGSSRVHMINVPERKIEWTHAEKK